MSQELVKAIFLLRPNAEFSFDNNDYSTIVWDKLEGDAPTKSEVDAAVEQVKANEAQAILDRATAKEAAQTKLTALGLSIDDLAALGL
jgi:hypothetical protein